MKKSEIDDSFGYFPYRPDYRGERTNNGGIDLTREPERIVEITEASQFPELRKLLIELNQPTSAFFTLGCEADYKDDVFYGYLEFAFKDDIAGNDLDAIRYLDSELYTWAESYSQELKETLRELLVWEYSRFLYHGNVEKFKVSLFFRTINKQDAGKLLATLGQFFRNRYGN